MSGWKWTPLGRVLAELSRTGQTFVRCTPSSLSGCRGDAVHVPGCRYDLDDVAAEFGIDLDDEPEPSPAERRRVAAEQEHPRLHIWRDAPGYWHWRITGPGGEVLDSAWYDTHPEALAVGLAALEVASLHPTR